MSPATGQAHVNVRQSSKQLASARAWPERRSRGVDSTWRQLLARAAAARDSPLDPRGEGQKPTPGWEWGCRLASHPESGYPKNFRKTPGPSSSIRLSRKRQVSMPP